MIAKVGAGASTGVVDLPDLDSAFIEAVEQSRIDAHLSKVHA